MKVTPIHAQWPWSDYRLAQVQNGQRIKNSPKDRSNWEASRVTPAFSVAVHEDSVELHVDRGAEPEQIGLGAVAAAVERFWKIDNARTIISFGQAKMLTQLLGWRSALYRNSWKKRIYSNPLLIKRSTQRYQAGFDSLCRLLGVGGSAHPLTSSDFYGMSIRAIGPTLEPAEARRFYEATR